VAELDDDVRGDAAVRARVELAGRLVTVDAAAQLAGEAPEVV
jgi:hypothetical protein